VREDKTTCAYCGKSKEGLSFVIGASNKPDWCMVEGTGKMTCPECYNVAMEEGQERIRKHIEGHNKRVEASKDLKVEIFHDGEEIRVRNVAALWEGKLGKVLRWVHDGLYVVEVDNITKKIEIFLDSSKGELEKL